MDLISLLRILLLAFRNLGALLYFGERADLLYSPLDSWLSCQSYKGPKVTASSL